MLQLMSPRLDGQGGTRIASMVAKGSDTPAGRVLEKFEVEEGTATLWKAGEDLLPAALGFVAVGKLYMCVLEGEGVFRELFQADYDVVVGRGDPAAFWNEGRTDGGEFVIVEDAEGGSVRCSRRSRHRGGFWSLRGLLWHC